MNTDDSMGFRVMNPFEMTFCTFVDELASVRTAGINAADSLDQGGLARAVFSA